MLRQQTGTVKEFVEPIDIKTAKGEYKKAYVAIEYKEKGKGDKEFTKVIAPEVFGDPEKFLDRWRKLREQFTIGDSVDLRFDVSSRRGNDKNGNPMYFTQANLIFLNHADKSVQQDKGQSQDNSMEAVEDGDDDLPF